MRLIACPKPLWCGTLNAFTLDFYPRRFFRAYTQGAFNICVLPRRGMASRYHPDPIGAAMPDPKNRLGVRPLLLWLSAVN